MQHTKVSEVQCFLRSLVIERFHPLDWKGTHRTTDHPRFSVDSLPQLKTGKLLRTHSLHRGRDTWQGITPRWKKPPWATTRAGHQQGFNINTGSVCCICRPASEWYLNEWHFTDLQTAVCHCHSLSFVFFNFYVNVCTVSLFAHFTTHFSL